MSADNNDSPYQYIEYEGAQNSACNDELDGWMHLDVSDLLD